MGLLDRFRSPRPTVEITVLPDRVRPGDAVEATIAISGEVSPRVERIEVGLFGGAAWSATAVSPLASGYDHRIVAPQRWVAHEDLVEVTVGPGVHHRTLVVPADAPPSCTADGLQLMVWSVLVRGHGGPHLNEAARLRVLADPEEAVAREQLPPHRERDHPDVDLQLDVGRRVTSGGTVAGVLVVTAARSMRLEGIEAVVELCRVTADDERFDGRFDHPVRAYGSGAFVGVVAGHREPLPVVGEVLAAGEQRRVPLSIQLPAAGFTTIATRRVCTHALVRVELRADGVEASTEVELNVTTD